MPNWVYNSLAVEGPHEDIQKLKTQLNQPFSVEHDSFDVDTREMKRKLFQYNNPVFAFWNITKPDNIEEYHKQPEHSNNILDFSGDDWYNWNVRNWGTKWDVAVHDDEQYSDTEITDEVDNAISYRFNTAWSPPVPAIETLSAQYPTLTFNLNFEEETGWGGEIEFVNGQQEELESYGNKCRDCDSIDTMEYCENDCGEICSSCNWLGEADLDCVAECDTHKVYLDEEHVPDYRMDKING